MRIKRRASRAFTLVELMVAVSVIALLIAITLPALAGARIEARKTQSTVNARTIASVFHQYADLKGHYPFVRAGERPEGMPADGPTLPPGIIAVRWWPEGVILAQGSHWGHARVWPGIVSTVAPWPEHYATWVSPGRSTELPDLEAIAVGGGSGGAWASSPINAVSYQYSNSFVARPAVWQSGSEQVLAENMLGPVRPSEVAHPANKVMLYDAELAYLRRSPKVVNGHWQAPAAMAFADGHAALHDPTEAAPGFANPLNGGDNRTLHNTPEGILGRDY